MLQPHLHAFSLGLGFCFLVINLRFLFFPHPSPPPPYSVLTAGFAFCCTFSFSPHIRYWIELFLNK
ncbi:hypothetical protein C8R46DRAFT_613174 [Mycena filopes]|nr:hypothetical protein C8R46DRAFT_613174 [Mycena filopes]